MADISERFDFSLPAGWEDQTVYHFRGPEIDGRDHKLTLVIDRHLKDADAAKFAARRTRPVIDSLQGVEVLKDEETTVPGCFPTYEFVYKWIPADGLVIYRKYFFVLRGRFGYTFDIEFSKKTYKMLGNQVKEVIDKLLPGTYSPLEE